MSAVVEAWLGLSLCAAAAGSAPRGGTLRWGRRLTAAHDRSRAGRRLQGRLEAAQLDMTPTTWRAAQLMALVPVALATLLAGLPWTAAATAATAAVRAGGWLILRSRACRHGESISAAVPGMARALAAEIRSGTSLGDALATVARSAAESGVPRPAQRILATAAGAAAVGDDPAAVVEAWVAGEAPAARLPLRRLGAALALVRRGAGPTPLLRVAASVEESGRIRRQSAAGFAEVRASSLLVPVLGGVILAVLLRGQPSAAAAAATPLGLLVLGTCLMVCAGGILAVRRLTAVRSA